MSARLVIAVPAKGRLQENAHDFFARAGLALVKPRGARDYRGAVTGVDEIEVAYLSAGEIAAQLATNGSGRHALPVLLLIILQVGPGADGGDPGVVVPIPLDRLAQPLLKGNG